MGSTFQWVLKCIGGKYKGYCSRTVLASAKGGNEEINWILRCITSYCAISLSQKVPRMDVGVAQGMAELSNERILGIHSKAER